MTEQAVTTDTKSLTGRGILPWPGDVLSPMNNKLNWLLLAIVTLYFGSVTVCVAFVSQ